MSSQRPTTDYHNAIDFYMIHPLTARGPGEYFKVRGLILHVYRRHTGSERPIWEVWNATTREGPEIFRASAQCGFVGRKHAWAAQAYAHAHGLLLPKGGKA